MTKEEAREKFQLADRLFNEQRYAPALKVLTELNAVFPNERNVLYPMARCLTGLGRNAEALDLADRVVRQFDYGPAVDLYKRLKAMKSGGGIGMLDSGSDPVLPPGGPTLDSDPIELPPGAMKFDSGPIELPAGMQKFDSDPVKLSSEFDSLMDRPGGSRSAPPPLPPSASGTPWLSYGLWAGLVLGGLAVMIAITPGLWAPIGAWWSDIQANSDAYITDPSLEPAFPVGPLRMLVLAWTVYWYVPTCLCAYLALYITDGLLFGDFTENMKDIAKYNLAGTLLSMVPLFGWIAILVLLKKHYDLPYLRLMGTVMLYEVFSFGCAMVLGGIALVVISAIS